MAQISPLTFHFAGNVFGSEIQSVSQRQEAHTAVILHTANKHTSPTEPHALLQTPHDVTTHVSRGKPTSEAPSRCRSVCRKLSTEDSLTFLKDEHVQTSTFQVARARMAVTGRDRFVILTLLPRRSEQVLNCNYAIAGTSIYSKCSPMS